ncbi:MAG: hypothetical protein KAJ51_09480 [Thermoplasmata archaeon]|nr:hypothetical protein [Thermoplasmata archaeon]
MKSRDISSMSLTIVTLFSVLLFLIWDNPIFIVPITLGFGLIGYVSLRKEPKPVSTFNSKS